MSEMMWAYGMYCGPLSPKEVAWLGGKGVHSDVLGWRDKQFAVMGASVRWEGECWFDFDTATGKRAVIIMCLDEHGVAADLAAWSPSDGRLGLCWGNVAMIGQEQVHAPRLDGDKLWVHETPLDWLVHRRSGVVIANYDKARAVLAGVSPVAVKKAAHKAELEAKWRAPRVQVFDVGVAEAIAS